MRKLCVIAFLRCGCCTRFRNGDTEVFKRNRIDDCSLVLFVTDLTAKKAQMNITYSIVFSD